MKKDILLIDSHTPKDAWAESYISFNAFTNFLRDKIASGQGIKIEYYKYVLDKILVYPELQGDIPIHDIHRYEDLLELVSTIVFPIMEDENEFFWALGNALTPEVFYGSNAFYNLLNSDSEWYIGDEYIASEESSTLVRGFLYELILQKLYNYSMEQRKEWIHGFINPVSGLYQYYRINIDKRFITLKTRTNLPLMDKYEIEACLAGAEGVKKLEHMLPLKEMIASGFSIITLTNVTARQAIEQISKEVTGINVKNSVAAFNKITRLLQTIAGNQHYRFGLMPIFTINKRAALLYENFPFSIIVKTCVEQGVPKKTFDTFIKSFLKSPALITHFPSSKNKILPEIIQHALNKSNITFYSLAPVYAGTQLVGIFEISTDGAAITYDNHLRDSLRPVVPFIAQLLQFFVDKFKNSINTIIKEQFTNIQPSVEWKFNEVAWHYFRNHMVEKKNAPIETIAFTDVYPLYGAIDIQNSTIERNKALRKDLLVQLNHLRDILQAIEQTGFTEKVKDFMVACDHWLYQLSDFITIEQEFLLDDFLQLEAGPYLDTFRNERPDLIAKKITRYHDAIDEDEGDAYFERRRLESSISVINSAVGQYLDLLKVEMQSSYPCYFEKIRTDGIEYDIYLGQSIAPKTPFKETHLHKTRLIQLQAMAAIARLTHSLLPQLEHELHTTQLVFVHSRPIDISFRNDERRFDVEGAYNIRYHIIKKRIDKVHLKDTAERLVQVGKIAIVYYDEKDIAEYQSYIHKLQERHILLNNMEYFELEDLQGVSGLKALRVGVRLG
ncbi:MAG: hypothetical protein ABIQ31_13055 [Ferruginibacter sp.]